MRLTLPDPREYQCTSFVFSCIESSSGKETYMCAYIFNSTYIYSCTSKCVCKYIYAFISTRMYIHIKIYFYSHPYVHTQSFMNACMYVCTPHKPLHASIYLHTCTHTHRRTPRPAHPDKISALFFSESGEEWRDVPHEKTL